MDVELNDFTYAPEAESYVIGALLKEPMRVLTLIETIGCDATWFQNPKFARIVSTVMLLRSAGSVIEMDTIINSLKQQRMWNLVGTECIHNAQISCKTVHNSMTYLQILKDRYLKRAILNQFSDYSDLVASDMSGADILSKIRFSMSEIGRIGNTKKTFSSMLEGIKGKYYLAQQQKSIGIASRWETLQKILSGYVEGKMSIIASRPGQGKTTMGSNECLSCIKRTNVIPCGYVSMEMTEEEIREKLAADELDLDLKRFRSGLASNAEIEEFSEKIKEHSKLPVFISDGNKTIEKVCITLRDMASDGCRFAVIDYIQRIQQGKYDPSGERERLSGYSNKLCDIANETGLHAMVLCQLRRESEFDQHGKRILPRMEHLKGTGEFEQDAHQIILIGRSLSLEGDREQSDKQQMIIKVVKNRNGGLSSGLEFVFVKSRQKFISQDMYNMERQ